jgi:AraC family transcriptional activator of pobA
MANIQPTRIKTVSQYHRQMGLPKPEHPLISLIDLESVKMPVDKKLSVVFDFYSISLKRNFNGRMKYGQQDYDFDEGIMFFISPGQVFSITSVTPSTRPCFCLKRKKQ